MEPTKPNFPATEADLLQAGAAFFGSPVPPERHIQIAETLFKGVLYLNPENSDALSNMGTVCLQTSRPKEARDYAARAVALDPSKWAPWVILGQAYGKLNQFREAKICVEQAVSLDPDQSAAWFTLAGFAEIIGDYPRAEDCYRRAIGLNPNDHQSMFSWGIIKMLQGDYSYGLPMYEGRLRHYQTKFPIGVTAEIAEALKNGEVGDIVIEAEQGVGDLFQVSRYAAMLQQYNATVTLHCQDNLAELMSAFVGIDKVVKHSEPWTPKKHTISAMSLLYLAALLGKDIYQPPACVNWPAAVSENHSWPPRIGYCRKGNPEHANDRFRSIPELDFQPIMQAIGDAGEGIDLSVASGTWEDTMRRISECDLIVTVDTAVAHLAGTIGKPVWLLIAAVPDWRWGLGTRTTPWYPNMQLFRQPQPPMQWGSTVDLIASKIRSIYGPKEDSAGSLSSLTPSGAASSVR